MIFTAINEVINSYISTSKHIAYSSACFEALVTVALLVTFDVSICLVSDTSDMCYLLE